MGRVCHRRSSCHVGRVVSWVELSRGSSCLVGQVGLVGQVVSWVKLSRGSSCLVGQVVSWVEFFVGRVVTRVELSQGSSCHKGRVVTRVELSRGSSCLCRVVTWVEMT